jgi:hypothetical protein
MIWIELAYLGLQNIPYFNQSSLFFLPLTIRPLGLMNQAF